MTFNETKYRRKVYLENLAKIKRHNNRFRKGLESYSLAMNAFGHLSEKEFLKKYTGSYFNEDMKNWEKDYRLYDAPENVTLPKAVDWRSKGAVTKVKSQSACGSCYAFGSIAAIEGQYAIKRKKLVDLSTQQIIDCSRNRGCKGGYLALVFEYARDTGLTTEASYPYEALASTCRLKKLKIVAKLKQFERVNPSAIENLQAAVALLGPVTIAVNTSKWQFLSGKEILIDNWCNSNVNFDHFLSVVGYNTAKGGINYWIIKNSWGPHWGDHGYVYLEHTKADKCRIVQLAVIPYLDKIYYTEKLTPAEEEIRKQIYLENLAIIQEHNDRFIKGLVPYRLEINEFAHLTDEEFDEIYSGTYTDDFGKNVFRYGGFYQAPKNEPIPEAVNWNNIGAVTSVKAQNRCGSCYAFALVGALESLYYIKYGKLVPFSEQQIIDCGRTYGLQGCQGGTVEKAFNYARNVGLTEAAEYPYENATGPCRIQDLSIVVKARSFQYINNYAIRDMEAAIAFKGPVIANLLSPPIRALGGTDIFSGDTCTDRKTKNHAVVVVGYNTTADGQKFWIIKNNWGTRWGDQGYFYVDRKKEDPCGLTVGAYVIDIE